MQDTKPGKASPQLTIYLPFASTTRFQQTIYWGYLNHAKVHEMGGEQMQELWEGLLLIIKAIPDLLLILWKTTIICFSNPITAMLPISVVALVIVVIIKIVKRHR